MENYLLQPSPHNLELQSQLNHKVELLLLTGAMLMESAADTSRVLRTLERVATSFGFDDNEIETHVNFNMLMISVSKGDISCTKFKRVLKHGVNMSMLESISRLSCRAASGKLSLDDYERELQEIKNTPRHYTPWVVALGGGLACGGFCIQFGADWAAFCYASIAAILGLRLRMWINAQPGSNGYIATGVSAFVATLIAWFSAYLTHFSPLSPMMPALLKSATMWHPMLACALFIIPGVPLINFVSDLLSGHTQVGIARATNTLLIVVSMAFGIACAIGVCGVDDFVHDLSLTPHHSYVTFAVAACVSAIGFSMIFNAPPRLLWAVGLGGIVAVCCRNIVNLGPANDNIGLGMGLVVGSMAGSVLISLLSTRFTRFFDTPHQCLSIPSVIPMIPGVLMYRSLFAFISMQGAASEVAFGVQNAINASLVILCIAAGVAIPNIFMRSLLAKPVVEVAEDKLPNAQQSSNCGGAEAETINLLLSVLRLIFLPRVLGAKARKLEKAS